MVEVTPGATAPADVNVPGAQPVPGSGAPTDQNNPQPPTGSESVQPLKTYSEQEMQETVNKRLSKERRRLERTVRAEVERDYLREQHQRGSQPPPSAREQPGDSAKGKPKATDYQDPEQYLDALTDWKVEQRMAKATEESSKASRNERAEQAKLEHAQALRNRLREGARKFADYEDVTANEDVDISNVMAHAIDESDIPADLNYFLCSNPDEAERIAKLPPTRQAQEMGKLEDKLKAGPKPTAAPAPIKPNDSTGSPAKDTKDMSTEEWMKWRDADLKDKGRRF